MKKKRSFHCQECGNECQIYRKGKRHRILICPHCGILATNPLPLLAAGALIKGAVGLGKKLISKGASAAAGLSKSISAPVPGAVGAPIPIQKQTITKRYDNLDKYNSKDKIELALR